MFVCKNCVVELREACLSGYQVFLGEGYFADRTAKQTVDILNRRGQALKSQVDSLKAVIKDLKAEASFFDRTAAESVVSFRRLLILYCLLFIICFRCVCIFSV